MTTYLLDNTTGSRTFTVPSGITQIQIELWGPGGNGGNGYANGNPSQNSSGGGGGGGGYGISRLLTVTPGQVISYTIGAPHTNSTVTGNLEGNPSWIITATYGQDGNAASQNSSIDVNGGTAGGATGNVEHSNGGFSGFASNNAGVSNGGIAKGGNGGYWQDNYGNNGSPGGVGSTYGTGSATNGSMGDGGGGGSATNLTGGLGGGGQIKITDGTYDSTTTTTTTTTTTSAPTTTTTLAPSAYYDLDFGIL